MLKFLRWLVIALAVVVVLAVAAAYYLLQDPNRFKPQIEATIEEQTGARVDLGDDLSWVIFPPLALSASDITADYEGSHYQLDRLRLKLDLMSVLRNRSIDEWEVEALTVNGLQVDQEGSRTRVEYLELRNFRPAVPSPFKARLVQQPAEGPELPLSLDGLVAFDPNTNKASVKDTRFETTDASGVCNLTATYKPGAQPPDPDDAIIPVSIWRSVDWSGDCLLDRLTLENEDFRNVTVTLANTGARSTTEVQIPEFFQGSAAATVDIDASATPVRWRVKPDLARADSTEVMAWLNQRLKWIAPLAYSGEITMTGNTEEELIHSVKGKTVFDGGQGRIDISQIKQPLLKLASLVKDADRIAAWPDLWSYQRLVGDWKIDGTHHELDFALDNLAATIKGTYDPLADALDANVQFLFENNPDISGFDVNPLLLGLPIPVTCKGSLEAPKCGVTREGTKELVAAVLTSEQGSDLRQELDRKIDEEVPEEYRDAARGLLDMLGDSLKKPQNQKTN